MKGIAGGYFHVEIWSNMSGYWSHVRPEFVEQVGPTETNRWRVTLTSVAEKHLPIGIIMRLTMDVFTPTGTMLQLCAAWQKVHPLTGVGHQWNELYSQPLNGRAYWVRKA